MIQASSAIIGGASGAAGSGSGDSAGTGGYGVVGHDLTILNAGTIIGGQDAHGGNVAAVDFTGGTNVYSTVGSANRNLLVDSFIIASGSLTLDQSLQAASATYGGVTGGGSLIIDSGKHSVTLTGTTDVAGGVTVDEGSSLVLNNLGSGATISAALSMLKGASVTLAYGATVSGKLSMADNTAIALKGSALLSGNVVVSGTSTFNVTGTNSVGAITGSGNIVVLGASGTVGNDVLTMTGASNYTGTTTIGDGTVNHAVQLTASGANDFSATSVTTVNTNGTVDLGGGQPDDQPCEPCRRHIAKRQPDQRGLLLGRLCVWDQRQRQPDDHRREYHAIGQQ